MDFKISSFLILVSLIFLTGDVESQYRDKKESINQETDAVQTLLARYLQRRLQDTQLSTPPPPSILFSSNQHRANVRQAMNNGAGDDKKYQRGEDNNNDYTDDDDDLQGFEDSDRSRTRINLLAIGNSISPIFSEIIFPPPTR